MRSQTQSRGSHESKENLIPVLIIGAGASGIAMGCQLKRKLGFEQFRIYDRLSGIGGAIGPSNENRRDVEAECNTGTWWSNRYPGVVRNLFSSA